MATFDQLSAEQRAIIELVLKQGQTYEGLAGMLGMPPARVKELARASLVILSPVSAAQVEEDWRGPVTDYLLGQQSASEAAATKGHLRRSEAARAWSRSLLDSLDHLYVSAKVPTIPPGAEPVGKKAPPARREQVRPAKGGEAPSGEAEPPREKPSPAARDVVLRRRVAGAGAFAVLALLAILLWPVGLLTGEQGDKADARDDAKPAARVIGQLELKPVEGARGQGLSAIVQRGAKRQLIVQALLPKNADREAYEVWLYNSDRDARSLGAQVTDRRGTFEGIRNLPSDFARWKFIDISREKVDQAKGHSGTSVLRGQISDFTAPPPQASGTQTQP